MNRIATEEKSEAVRMHSNTIISKAFQSLEWYVKQKRGNGRKFKIIKQKREHKMEKHFWYSLLIYYNK